MRRGLVLVAMMLLAALPAYAAGSAGKAPESVTVTGTRSHQVIQDFVRKFTVPTRVAGKITRWGEGICPQTVGLRPSAVRFINDRLRAVAKDVGAPVNGHANCVVNIEIVFTTTPQAMIDHVREKRPDLLGYADNEEKIAALAKVVRPIQAWYSTQTRDLHGKPVLDVAHRRGVPLEIPCPPSTCYFPDAVQFESTGSRLGDGLRSEFHHVIVVADPTKLTDYSVGQLADYIALMALSQVATPDACQPIASITNLLAPGCAQTPDAISATDLAYLRGLYRMHAGMDWRIQRHEIVSEIEQDAGGL